MEGDLSRVKSQHDGVTFTASETLAVKNTDNKQEAKERTDRRSAAPPVGAARRRLSATSVPCRFPRRFGCALSFGIARPEQVYLRLLAAASSLGLTKTRVAAVTPESTQLHTHSSRRLDFAAGVGEGHLSC